MPGTVKSELLTYADRSHKCDSQEKVCWMLYLPLDKSHFITETLTCMSKKAGRPDCECRSDRMSAQHGAVRGLSWFVVSALAGTEVCAIRPGEIKLYKNNRNVRIKL